MADKPNMGVAVTGKLSVDEYHRLAIFCDSSDRSRSWVIARAVKEFLDRQPETKPKAGKAA